MAAMRNTSPSSRFNIPNLAPQSRVAFASMASKTGSSSPGELEMTCSTSEVAVCCSSASDKLARPRLHLVEQPHVLDRDHRLVGEGSDQLDLLFGERAHSFALHDEDPDWGPFAQKWDTEQGTKAAKSLALKVGIFGIS